MRDFAEVRRKYESQLLKFLMRTFRDAKAEEFARHGYCRRLNLLARTIENVFTILPVDRSDIPSREEISDAAINAQAMIFNTFGAIDNLAWVLVHEKGLANSKGRPIRFSEVGLGPKCATVRSQLSPEMQRCLISRDDWFAHLEDFRHALAHRIPMYIPPYGVPETDADKYRRLEVQKEEAWARRDHAAYSELESKQEKLARFSPIYTHSFAGRSNSVVLHAQLLADYATIEEIGTNVLEELDR